MDAVPTDQNYAFGEFRLDPRRRVVHRVDSGEALELTPKAFGVLLHLVEHAGEIVDKSALFAAVWPSVVVEESNLTQTIHVLRRALGEHPADHRYIVTVPGRGYRFVAEVEPRAGAAHDADTSTIVARPSTLRDRRVVGAVALAALLAAGVVPIALERRALAPAVPALADPPSSAMPRARDAADTLPPPDAAAHEHALRGQFFVGRRAPGDLVRARESFLAALALDPGDARAWAGVASVAYLRTETGDVPRAAGLAELRAAAQRAIDLDPMNAEGHLRLSNYHCLAGDHEIARRYLAEGIRVAPDDPLALALAAGMAAQAGRFDDAVALQRRAVARDPLAATHLKNLGMYLYAGGRFDEARAELAKAHDLAGDSDTATVLGEILLLRGEHDAALRQFESVPDDAARAYGLALVHHAQGRRREADAALARLQALAADTDPFLLAEVHAQRGEVQQALESLERARPSEDPRRRAQAGDPPWLMAASPFLAPLRGDPRWPDWLTRRE